jgi:hypothetical protein
MRTSVLIALALLGSASARAADEPSGCDKFKWPIDRERVALTAPDLPRLESSAEIAAPPAATILALRAPGDAALPSPPERPSKEGTFAGFARFKAPPRAGIYTVSLSAGAWVDVVQDGHILKPTAFSGATDCDGIRKSMKYQLAASPFVLQISGTKENSISAAVLPSQ